MNKNPYLHPGNHLNGAKAKAEILKVVCPKTVAPLLAWIEAHLSKHEFIDIFEWSKPLFYIEVRDNRILERYPACVCVGWTVDIRKDRIFYCDKKNWNADNGMTMTSGNCFVRSNKWKRLLSPDKTRVVEKQFAWYQAVKVPKKVDNPQSIC